MLYPMHPKMTREEMAQFDRLRYLESHVASCHEHYLQNREDRRRLVVMIANNKSKLPELEAAVAAVDPKNQRALEAAQGILDAFTKQGQRLNAEWERTSAKNDAINRALDEFYAQRADIEVLYPVVAEAMLPDGNR